MSDIRDIIAKLPKPSTPEEVARKRAEEDSIDDAYTFEQWQAFHKGFEIGFPIGLADGRVVSYSRFRAPMPMREPPRDLATVVVGETLAPVYQRGWSNGYEDGRVLGSHYLPRVVDYVNEESASFARRAQAAQAAEVPAEVSDAGHAGEDPDRDLR
jgi:hypothetical protein